MNFPIYLDNCATTALDPRALEAMLPFFQGQYGNPASVSHALGAAAEKAVKQARGQIAELIGAGSKEIIFTGGATESNNLALIGAARKYRERGKHLITCRSEHHAVVDTCGYLEQCGFAVTYLPVDRLGMIDLDELRNAIQADTILISLMAANNETGVLHPLLEIGRIARERKVLFHTDATQAVGKIPIDVQAMNIDLLSMTGHKMYGPKGSGALYLSDRNPRVSLEPLLHGGGQERGLRSGTLNVPGIVGLAAGVEYLLEKDVSAIRAHHLALRELLCSGLEKMQNITLYGPMSQECVGVVSFSISGYAPQEVAAMLDSAYGIQVRAGYHCAADIHDTIGSRETGGTVRISLGPFNDEVQIAQVLKAVGQIATEAPI